MGSFAQAIDHEVVSELEFVENGGLGGHKEGWFGWPSAVRAVLGGAFLGDHAIGPERVVGRVPGRQAMGLEQAGLGGAGLPAA